MPKEFSRTRRVGELMQRELAELIQRRFSVEKNGMITVSEVTVTPDLRQAKIYITVLGKDINETVGQLNERAGEFRHELSKRLSLRITPRLTFSADTVLENANRLTALIDQAVAHDQQLNPHKEEDDQQTPKNGQGV